MAPVYKHIVYLIEFILVGLIECIGNMILFILGWENLNALDFKFLVDHDRAIVVYPHTTYLDFFSFIIYKMANYRQCVDLFFFIKPQIFYHPLLNRIMKLIKAIPATSITDVRGGAVNESIKYLSQFKRFHVLISPEGTIAKTERWRSGYYHLADKLDAVILVSGLDWNEHKMKILIENPNRSEGLILI